MRNINLKPMAQQTAMQQLIQWMKDNGNVIPFDQGDCYNEAIELLQMEKEQIIHAWREGDNDSMYSPKELDKQAEQYYNETYKKQ